MKLRYFILLTAILLLLPEDSFSQAVVVTDIDKQIFNKYSEQIDPYQSEPLEIILEQTARFFLGTPYVAHTLDKTQKEELVVNLHELDCVTFVENVLALSLATYSGNLSEDYFVEKLTKIRYRNNEVMDYASRIHYTSDWIFENERKGLIRNISKELSGVKETKRIDFMSSHRSAYQQLATDDAMLSEIIQIENIINDRGGFYYLPKELIAAKANKIPHMAVIGFVTSIDGLDTTHVGFAFHEGGRLTFIHASTGKMEVVIDSKTLSDYCLSQKNCKGIIVAKVTGNQ